MELTNSFETLLLTFSPVFTTPSFATFRLLMTGWILSVRHRYVTDLIAWGQKTQPTFKRGKYRVLWSQLTEI